MKQAAIVGVGFTPLKRKTEQTLPSLALEAAIDAIEDAGLKQSDIDGYSGSPFAYNLTAQHADGADEVSAHYMVTALGLKSARWLLDAPRGLIADPLISAIHALAFGSCNYVLIVRAMYNPLGVRYAEANIEFARGTDQFISPYGLSGGIWRIAMWLQRYLHEYGATKAELYHVAKTLRDHAQRNPYAYWRGTLLSEDDYLGARQIFEPMGLYDCDIPVTGAGALVLTTADRAAHLRHEPAYITAFATGYEDGDAIYRKSGLQPADVQCAQFYDGFLPFVWWWLEQLRFCGKGEAHQFALNGNIALGGALPVNTFGGQQGEGRLHGMGHVREGALQVMGRAGERQVPGVEHCMVALGAEFAPGVVALLSREAS